MSARSGLLLLAALFVGCARGDDRDKAASADAAVGAEDAGPEDAGAPAPPEKSEAEREAERRAEDLAQRPPGDWRRFPLPPYCNDNTTNCRTPAGEPGLRCGYDEVCFNPCPAGLVPEEGGRFCAARCEKQSDCKRGTCVEGGYCDRWPRFDDCAEPSFEPCDTTDGAFGRLCNGKCVNVCKPGHVTVGGTHCAKACRSDADCRPRGRCRKDDGPPYTCGGLCPSGFCPYPYD